jgi:hypothetical protein
MLAGVLVIVGIPGNLAVVAIAAAESLVVSEAGTLAPVVPCPTERGLRRLRGASPQHGGGEIVGVEGFVVAGRNR